MMKFSLLIIFLFSSIFGQAQEVIKAVYFAQTHVVKFDYVVPNTNEKLKIIGDREMLLKVNITSSIGGVSPQVKAKLDLNNTSTEINLVGPANLPTSFNDTFGQVVHSFSDSFTGVVPKEWVKPGLKITIFTPTQSLVFDNLSIGAQNRIYVTNFEINAFRLQNSPFENGWEKEFGTKLPTAEFAVQNIPNILFEEISAPPLKGRIAARFNSLADYKVKTGADFGEHNDVSLRWRSALTLAAGINYSFMKYMTVSWTFTDSPIKGVGGGYASVQRRGSASGLGIFIHEAGHALSLPHWGDSKTYPYKGEMFGIQTGSIYNGTHSGPIWGYDDLKRVFIKPTITNLNPLTYKNDPMQGGGRNNQEAGFLTNHFSDYSVNQMRSFLENRLVIYNELSANYVKWNNTTKSYSNVQANPGNVTYPIQREVDVISVMAAASSNTPQANIVYPPIGPYKSGIIAVFDPRVAADRTIADMHFCPTNGCDTTLKIQQGTTTKYIMLPTGLDATLAQSNDQSFITRAVNLPASDGQVFRVDLLSTPDSEKNGLPSNPAVLATWTSNTLSNVSQNNDFSNDIIINFKNNELKILGLEALENALFKVFSLDGKEIFSIDFITKIENRFNISNAKAGVYIVNVKSGSRQISKKVVLE